MSYGFYALMVTAVLLLSSCLHGGSSTAVDPVAACKNLQDTRRACANLVNLTLEQLNKLDDDARVEECIEQIKQGIDCAIIIEESLPTLDTRLAYAGVGSFDAHGRLEFNGNQQAGVLVPSNHFDFEPDPLLEPELKEKLEDIELWCRRTEGSPFSFSAGTAPDVGSNFLRVFLRCMQALDSIPDVISAPTVRTSDEEKHRFYMKVYGRACGRKSSNALLDCSNSDGHPLQGYKTIASPLFGPGSTLAYQLALSDDKGVLEERDLILVLPAGHVRDEVRNPDTFDYRGENPENKGQGPNLDYAAAEALGEANYLVVVNALELDPSFIQYVRLGNAHSLYRSLPCGWAKIEDKNEPKKSRSYCVSSRWALPVDSKSKLSVWRAQIRAANYETPEGEENSPRSLADEDYDYAVGSHVAVTQVAETISMIWRHLYAIAVGWNEEFSQDFQDNVHPDYDDLRERTENGFRMGGAPARRKKVLELFYKNCVISVTPEQNADEPDDTYGAGFALHWGQCQNKVKAAIKGEYGDRVEIEGDEDEETASAAFSGQGNLELAGAGLRWQSTHSFGTGSVQHIDRAAVSSDIHTPLSRLAPSFGHSGRIDGHWTLATDRFSNSHSAAAALKWTAGRHLWGFAAQGFAMVGSQWHWSPSWHFWAGVGTERQGFAGGSGTGSWTFGDTTHLQAVLGGNWALNNGWLLRSGLAVAHFRHADTGRSLVGQGRGNLAELWLKLQKNRFRFGLELNSGLHGTLELQDRTYPMTPRPQASLSFNWAL